MPVALIGASGRVGSRILKELSDRGHIVTAIARNPERIARLPGVTAVKEAGARRYLVVGGAGTLEVKPGVKLMDTPDFPEAFSAEAKAGDVFLGVLRAEPALDWTFLSPSAIFGPGKRTGSFRLGTDELLVGKEGSSISFEDYAIALVDEIEKPAHSRRRFTVGY